MRKESFFQSCLCVTYANLEVLSFTSQRKELRFQDWILGPKPVEDDLEEGIAEIEEERRLSVSSKLMEKDRLKMEKENDGMLPGFHLGEGGCRRPFSPPPLRSAIAASYPGEKRISTHSVTFACPMTPYVTSL